MKAEKIYEIPVNDAFDTKCECALCVLENNLEKKNVDYCLGPAMMKPEFRIETNKKGFCRRHLSKMLNNANKLPLALVLDTHLNELNEIIGKNTGFNKAPDSDYILKQISALKSSCVICENINNVLEKYMNVILYMWSTDPDFKKKFNNSGGFCIKHFDNLLNFGKSQMKKKEYSAFAGELIEIERRELARVNNDINWFTKKFDYKNHDADWKDSKDAPLRATSKLWGYIDSDD